MATGRDFRSPESYLGERRSRDMLESFLIQKGFVEVVDSRKTFGSTESQSLSAIDPSGRAVNVHVTLCWRRDGRNAKEKTYSAAQLSAKIGTRTHEEIVRAKVDRWKGQGMTHALFLQRDGETVVYAPLVPVDAVLPIWQQQRAIYAELIASGNGGSRRTKNYAENGSSPTIWLQDDRDPDAHRAAAAFWSYPGVMDLAQMSTVELADVVNDTYDDCYVDGAQFGSDGAPRKTVTRSMVKRDTRVRRAVADRAQGKCERKSCGETRSFVGFLDVHHILGAERSDRVWNCVALCPNCHRDAHYAPNQDAINAELLSFAESFKHAMAA